MEEIWKNVSGYEWIYQVNNFGITKSLQRWPKWKEKILKPRKSDYSWKISKDRPRVALFKNWIRINIQVSRLVASEFLWLDIKKKKMCVCHLDDNPWNNRVDNMFIWTYQDNYKDCYDKWRHYNNIKKK